MRRSRLLPGPNQALFTGSLPLRPTNAVRSSYIIMNLMIIATMEGETSLWDLLNFVGRKKIARLLLGLETFALSKSIKK